MIQLTTTEAMKKQIEKARAVKPFVKVTGWRRYEVRNRQTNTTYRVNFEVIDGARFAHCTCKAGQLDRPCYHIASAAGVHVVIAASQTAH
jgi:xanthine/CO dehydrogenase XdhC/CoxF family maturation factor